MKKIVVLLLLFLFVQPAWCGESRKNYFKLHGEGYNYTQTTEREHSFSGEISQQIGALTFVLNQENTKKFELSDTQTMLDIYSALGKSSGRWGYLSFAHSGDALLFPVNMYGITLYQSVGNYEIYGGYKMTNYRTNSFATLTAGTISYLPHGFTLDGKTIFVPANSSLSFASLIKYSPSDKLQTFYKIVFGKSVEEMKTYAEVSQNAGIEYRIDQSYSVSLDMTCENRDGSSYRSGLGLATKYSW